MKLHFEKNTKSSFKIDKRTDCYTWGDDNNFPYFLENLIDDSVTASIVSDLSAKYIYGKGLKNHGKKIINKDGQTLNELLRIASRQYAKNNNLFLHVSYNLLFEITSIKVLPCSNVRVAKKDDAGYNGKYIVYNNWSKSNGKIDKKQFSYFNRFNPNKAVIQAQIDDAGSIKKYNGQIIHIQKDSNAIYSLSNLNAVINDMFSENESQNFRAKSIGNGFLNTKLLVTQPFSNESDRRAFLRKMKELQGADNAGNILLLESGNMTDDLNSQVKLEDLSSKYNDKLCAYTDRESETNICKVMGVPLMLVNPNNSGVFGNSGELLKQAKSQLWENKEEERMMIKEVFERLLSNFSTPIKEEIEIISPLILNNN